jgi:predicted nuclease with TOPRIM domain
MDKSYHATVIFSFKQMKDTELCLISLYTVLGLKENAVDEEIEAAYKQLKSNLDSQGIQTNEKLRQQAEKCLQSIEHAHQTLKDVELKRSYLRQKESDREADITETHPRLGQLCVASGMITIEQLTEAVKSQLASGLQLGEVLQQKQFISQAELDGLLLGQQMIDTPSSVTEQEAARLISLGLITEDMGLIVQMQARTQGTSTRELVARHSWVDKLVLDAVLA